MFDCTVTTDLQSKNKNGFSGIVKHVSHDPEINHSNKDINFNESQFNEYNNDVSKLEKWNEEKFSDYVVNHDIKQRKSGHAERQYGSVKSFLSSKNKATLVLTIGNMDIQGKLMKRFCSSDSYHVEKMKDGSDHYVFNLDSKQSIEEAKRFYGCFNRALVSATSNGLRWKFKDGRVVKRSDYLFRGRYATNNDEMGISHIHCELGTFGTTRKGNRPTNSLNQALTSLYKAVNGKDVSGRVATKWYRDVMDKYALSCLEKELKNTYNIPKNENILKFDRLTEHEDVITGRSMEQLKADKKRVAEIDSQITNSKKKQDEINKVKNEAINALRNSYKEVVGHEAVNKDGEPLSPLECSRGIKKATDETKKQKDDLEMEVKKLNKERNDTADQVSSLNRQMQRLNQDLDDTDKEIKERKKRLSEVNADTIQSQVDHDKLSRKIEEMTEQKSSLTSAISEEQNKLNNLKRQRRNSESQAVLEDKASEYDRISEFANQNGKNDNKLLSEWVKMRIKAGQTVALERERLRKSVIKALRVLHVFDKFTNKQFNDVMNDDSSKTVDNLVTIADSKYTKFENDSSKSQKVTYRSNDNGLEL